MTQLDFEDLLAVEKYQSVGKLTREIKTILEGALPGVLVEGEISNFTHHSSGHMYFSLKDESAQISCTMWRGNNLKLLFMPAAGMKVRVKARLSVYEKRGNYQLDVWQMQPAGIGTLQLAFEELKRKLQEEGLFADEHKQPLPVYPESIGIVTSPTGAAIRDLKSVLVRRWPAAKMILKPVRVQGEGAAKEIAQAIDEFNDYGKVDVLLVSRGGGSIEDLWPFNEEIVARAIFRSHIPVVSAVGHEIDFTISDFVADFRAPTPSAAAELVVPNRDEIAAQLQFFSETMRGVLLERCKYLQEKLRSIVRSYAFGQPIDQVRQASQRLDDLRRQLEQFPIHTLALYREKVDGLKKRLTLLEQSNVLKRGYSICHSGNKLVTAAAQLNPEDKITVEFDRGRVEAEVEEVIL